MASAGLRQLGRDDYSIGWIVTLSIELASSKAMLDELHREPLNYDRNETDKNSYTYGRIGENNVVIASLASGVYGNTMATSTALGMLASFPNIKFGLLVGIGGGIPGEDNDIRLGDVAVSQPTGTSGGVFQYDLGKRRADGSWRRGDFLARPPEVLLKSLSSLKGDHELEESKVTEFLQAAATGKHAKWAKNYAYPAGASDLLFHSTYKHEHEKSTCEGCDKSKLVIRPPRDSADPQIHYGTIASGNSLVKDGVTRDEIAAMEPSCICLDMEASGLMNNFPCIVIRGISDYSDSHKNDLWQRYASATAAAFAKELVFYIQPREVEAAARAKSLVENTNDALAQLKKQFEQSNRDKADEKRGVFLKNLADSTCDYASGKNLITERIEGTGEWLTNHPIFKSWQQGQDSGLLWVTADPGTGKSVLSRYLVEAVLPVLKPSATICYFFFSNATEEQSSSRALCAILHQLFKHRQTVKEEILSDFHSQGSSFTQSVPILWNTLLSATSQDTNGEIICVLDGLDECIERERRELILKLSQFGLQSGSSSNLKFLVTSRPYRSIGTAFQEVEQKFPNVHLSGDGDVESSQIREEIGLVVKYQIKSIAEIKGVHAADEEFLYDALATTPHWNYIWPQAILETIEESFDVGTEILHGIVAQFPTKLYAFYEQLVSMSPDQALARKLFQIVLSSRRPLSVREISIFLNISAAHRSYGDFARFLQTEDREDRMRANIRELSGLLMKIVDSKVYFIHPMAREFFLQQSRFYNGRESLDAQHSRFGSVIARTTSFASSIGTRADTFLSAAPSRAGSYFSALSTDERHNSRGSFFSRTNSDTTRNTSVSSYTPTNSPPMASPGTFTGDGSTTTLVMRPDDPASTWRHSIDIASAHALLAEMCGVWLDMSSDEDSLPEIDRYCKTALFWHLHGAENRTTDDQNKFIIDLLDTKLRPYWSLIYRYMPNYDKDSLEYCPTPDDPVLNLLIYLGSCPLVKLELDRLSKSYPTTAPGNYPQVSLAAAKGDKAMLSLLLNYYNVNLKTTDDITPLHVAAHCGKLGAVKLLVEKGAFLEAKMKDGSRPLHIAVKHSRLSIVAFLLEHGAEIEAKPGEYGLTALHQAIHLGDVDIVKLLLEKDANSTTTQNGQLSPFIRAASCASLEILNLFFEAGLDIETRDQQGSRALHFAALRGRTANVEYLVDNLADINAVNVYNASPVTMAVRGRKSETLTALVSRSARCSLLDFQFAFQPILNREENWQPRHDWHGSVDNKIMSTLLEVVGTLPENDIQKFLCSELVILDAKAVSKILDSGGKASIASLRAALRRNLEYQRFRKWEQIGANVVETILERLDADVVGQADRRSLITVALQHQPSARVLQLLRARLILVEEFAKHERGTPFLFSAIEGDLQFVRELLNVLVAVDERQISGRTALSYALALGMVDKNGVKPELSAERRKEYIAIAELLLQRGADPDLPDKENLTPLDWAKLAGNGLAEQIVNIYRSEAIVDLQMELQIPLQEEMDALEAQGSPKPGRLMRVQTKEVTQNVTRATMDASKNMGKRGKDISKATWKFSKEASKEMGKDLGKVGKLLSNSTKGLKSFTDRKP